ncbi:MAG: HD domain-containing protein [Clostridia bacterium]|nr:HD domain-containing protein [Clostridia bacterium]
MRLNKEKALKLLGEAEELNPGRWIEHSKKVGDASRRFAEKLNLDTEKAEVLGLIHDIGKRYGEHTHHVINGYKFIKELGYDDEYANICITHSYLNNDINCTAGGVPSPQSDGYEFRKEFVKNHEYTIYEKIINFCDLMCTNKFMILEQRLIEIMTRRGVDTNTVYHIKEALKLRDELDEMLGCSVYELFPEIKITDK